MKTRAGVALAILFILSNSAIGGELKPDRAISIVSLERYEDSKNKGYKVEGKTFEPPVYDKLQLQSAQPVWKLAIIIELLRKSHLMGQRF